MCGEMEHGRCDVCGKDETLERTVFYYPIKCECHSPQHFEINRHGKNCTPKEPEYTSVQFKTEDLKNPVSIAISLLIDALKEDKEPGSYYYSWQSNIACAIMDTMLNLKYCGFKDQMSNMENIHDLANDAAKRFLENLIR